MQNEVRNFPLTSNIFFNRLLKRKEPLCILHLHVYILHQSANSRKCNESERVRRVSITPTIDPEENLRSHAEHTLVVLQDVVTFV